MLGTILLIVLVLALGISSCARGRTPCLAAQQGLGILSKQWLGTGTCDGGRAPVNRPYVTGARALT